MSKFKYILRKPCGMTYIITSKKYVVDLVKNWAAKVVKVEKLTPEESGVVNDK